MVSVTFLKVCCQSDVSFSCRRCSYSGLVDYIWLEAFSFEWTIWFLSAIAGVRLLRWWVEIWKNVLVVCTCCHLVTQQVQNQPCFFFLYIYIYFLICLAELWSGSATFDLFGLFPSSLSKSAGFVSPAGKASLVSLFDAILFLRS